METGDDPTYWKTKALALQSELEILKLDFEEYQESSASLEREYESEISINESRIKDLTATVEKLEAETTVLRSKLEEQSKNDARQHDDLSRELGTFKREVERMRVYVRELEQKNDDLERAHRIALGSIEDFETKYNQALEKNGMLESELDEKEHLKGLVQRLKDETRDLRSELTVTTAKVGVQQQPNKPVPPSFLQLDSNKNGPIPVSDIPTPRPPPSRLSPLSIVNDLLRKVGALESKLASYSRNGNKTDDLGSKRLKQQQLVKTKT